MGARREKGSAARYSGGVRGEVKNKTGNVEKEMQNVRS